MPGSKVPPHDHEVEQSLLGALIIDKDAIVNISSLLLADHFYASAHQYIYTAMLKLFEERDPIDLITLSSQLKKQKQLEKVGGEEYLTLLAEKVATAAHSEKYAKIIKDLANKRELIRIGSDIVEMAYDEGKDAVTVLDTSEREIFALGQKHLSRTFTPIQDALADSFERLDELHKQAGSLRGVPTGFKDLDSTLAGMQASNLLILAARPGVGKTAFSLNMAQAITVNFKIPVGIFSLEMSKEELVDRLIVSEADIDAWRLKTGNLKEQDFARISEAYGRLAEAPLFIDDTPGINLMEMRTKARRLQLEHDVKLLMVDYLQLAVGTKTYESRVQEVSEISQSLKNLARELKIPILALSQLSRAVESRGTKEPQLADLRESGAIEQDADVVMFLYRTDDENLENVSLKIAKHRNGPLRTVNLFFKGDRIRFYGMEKGQGGESTKESEE
ncbi:replicative DNA helicase [Candidatus Beckwithbacteria bacterium]|nr:replicative DNA helicase [Candidatus Beckwithbacteria bacterium]